MDSQIKSISILGLGQMGSALASAFLNHGHRVTVWNRTMEKANPLLERGAIAADSPASCTQSATHVIICLISQEVVEAVLSKLSMLCGCTVINFTTCQPQGIEEIADVTIKRLRATGYLHGSIMGPPTEVENRQATTFYAGDETLFAENQSLLGTLGDAIYLSDDLKNIALMENASHCMVAGVYAAFIQSLAFAGVGGIDRVTFTRQVVFRHLMVLPQVLLQMAKQDQEQSHSIKGDGMSVDSALTLLSNVSEAAEASAVSPRLLQGLQSLLVEGVELGKGSQDISAMVDILRGTS